MKIVIFGYAFSIEKNKENPVYTFMGDKRYITGGLSNSFIKSILGKTKYDVTFGNNKVIAIKYFREGCFQKLGEYAALKYSKDIIDKFFKV
jgi:hypothetical protein